MKPGTGLVAGAAAGAAGTTALNAITYLDMAFRGRGTSSAPEDTVEALADKAGVAIPGDDDTRQNRVSGLGPLTGLIAGVGVGAVLGLARTAGWKPHLAVAGLVAAAGAMVATDGPMAALGVVDPRSWAASDWLTDVVPHLGYGIVTAAVAQNLRGSL